MELINSFTGESYFVPVYEKEEGGKKISIIRHDTLQYLINEIMYKTGEISIDYDSIPAKDGYIVKCTIRNKNGFRVTEFGESSEKNTETDIAKKYPFLIAKQRAHDRAVIAFLGLRTKIFSDKEIKLTENDKEIIPQDLASGNEICEADASSKQGLTTEEISEINQLGAINIQMGNQIVSLGSLPQNTLQYIAESEEMDLNFRQSVKRYLELAARV